MWTALIVCVLAWVPTLLIAWLIRKINESTIPPQGRQIYRDPCRELPTYILPTQVEQDYEDRFPYENR